MTFDEVCDAVAQERAAGTWRTRLRWLNFHRLWLIGWAKYLTVYRLPGARPYRRDWHPVPHAQLGRAYPYHIYWTGPVPGGRPRD